MKSDISDILSEFDGGIRLFVKAKPGAKRERKPSKVDIGDGKNAVEISVSAAAEDGKANKAIIDRIADLFGVKRRDVSIKTGTASRIKIVEVAGETDALKIKFENLML